MHSTDMANDASTLPGAPQGPILIKWIKDCVEISWEPPPSRPLAPEILEYVIEERQKSGHTSYLCSSKVPQIKLQHFNGALKDYYIFATNKHGLRSRPLVVQNVPLDFLGTDLQEYDHFSVISKGVKSTKSQAKDFDTRVKIEEIESNQWRPIPISIQRGEKKSGFTIDSCYISSTLSLTIEHFLFKIVCKI